MTSMDTAPTALLVEDEPQIRRFVRTSLEEAGWQVHETDTVKRGLIEAGTRTPDLIVLSARAAESEKVRALDAGADDYLTKPFGVDELHARVRATLRRQRKPGADTDGVVRFGSIAVDTAARLVTRDGVKVHLTPIEYKLLAVLVNNAGRVVTNPQLLLAVWGPSHADDSHYLRIYMGHLRHKLEDDPAQPRYFLTETAVGYRLMLPL